MKFITLDTAQNLPPCVATIGFFDGVHRGHQFLIEQVMELAKAQGAGSMLITFEKHPRQVMQADYQPQLLSTPDEKRTLLARSGADCCVVLPFDEAMSRLSAHDFMERVLKRQLNVRTLVIGYDHHFGHNRNESFEDYVRHGHSLGMKVLQARACTLDGINISSSVIRAFLQEGEVRLANRCLGRDYSLQGHVVSGFQVGRTLGYPTANLLVDNPYKLIPATGVYAVRVEVGGMSHTGMLNIGTRPTLDNGERSIEIHILQFSGNVYGEVLRVAFVQRLRDEKKFRNTAELAHQLSLDAEAVTRIFTDEMKEK